MLMVGAKENVKKKKTLKIGSKKKCRKCYNCNKGHYAHAYWLLKKHKRENLGHIANVEANDSNVN